MSSNDEDESTKVESEIIKPVRPVAFLVVLQGLNAGDVVKVEKSACLLGRADEADLRLADRGVSSIHAVVGVDGKGDVSIQDLGSTNGTLVNDRRLEGVRRLDDGDKITIGATTILKFTFDASLKDLLAAQAATNRGRDPLTGAYQDAHFRARLDEEFAYARRHTAPLALAVLSIDGFHELRKDMGREAGDDVLAEFGRRARRVLTNEHLFARTGRRSFVVLFRGLSEREAFVVTDEIRKALGETAVLAGGRELVVTLSAGVAAIPFEGVDSPDQLVRLADLAVVDAKTTRNCVVPSKVTTQRR